MDIIQKLPLELSLNIITKYTGHFRLEKNDNKYKLIQQLDGKRKDYFEKIYNPVKPNIDVRGILGWNPLIIVKVCIFIKDIANFEKVLYVNDSYTFDVNHPEVSIMPGSLKKYQIIEKSFNLNNNFNPYGDPHYGNYNIHSYTNNLFKTQFDYYVPVQNGSNTLNIESTEVNCIAEYYL